MTTTTAHDPLDEIMRPMTPAEDKAVAVAMRLWRRLGYHLHGVSPFMAALTWRELPEGDVKLELRRLGAELVGMLPETAPSPADADARVRQNWAACSERLAADLRREVNAHAAADEILARMRTELVTPHKALIVDVLRKHGAR